MNKIHINREGTSLGVFTLQEVQSGLRDGRFLPADLAWFEGMAEWKPIQQIPELNAVGAAVGDDHEAGQAADELQPVSFAVQDGPSWEQRETLGFFPAMIATLKEVLLDPVNTFATMKKTGGFANPLLFYAIIGLASGLANVLYNLLFQAPALAQMGADAEQLAAAGVGTGASIISMLVMLPFMILIGLFGGAGLYHLCLMLVGGATQPYEATFRVVAYGAGSTAVVQFVPICGAYGAVIWALVLTVIGFTKVHEAPTGKAVLAVLLPALLCCGILIAIMFAGFGVGMMSAMGG